MARFFKWFEKPKPNPKLGPDQDPKTMSEFDKLYTDHLRKHPYPEFAHWYLSLDLWVKYQFLESFEDANLFNFKNKLHPEKIDLAFMLMSRKFANFVASGQLDSWPEKNQFPGQYQWLTWTSLARK